MIKVCKSNIILPCVRLSGVWPSVKQAISSQTRVWWGGGGGEAGGGGREFKQTCYMTSPHGKGVRVQVCPSVC